MNIAFQVLKDYAVDLSMPAIRDARRRIFENSSTGRFSMSIFEAIQQIKSTYISSRHSRSDYFTVIKKLVTQRNKAEGGNKISWQQGIDEVYALLEDEIITNHGKPLTPVKFGTSGWRGLLGKDIFTRSVAGVTAAILTLYRQGEDNREIMKALGISSFKEMQERGAVVGFDNRFGGEIMARAVVNVLNANGVFVYYAGEATTGILSASVLERRAAFSINLTPSHNPLEYGGFKYNAADAGPAAPILTDTITANARDILNNGSQYLPEDLILVKPVKELFYISHEPALLSWQSLVRKGLNKHGINYYGVVEQLAITPDMVVGVDCMHGSSRKYIRKLLGKPPQDRLFTLRDTNDPTFGGIAPEPSSANIKPVMVALQKRKEKLKIGVIIDPDGDRIRFTDGETEISMNQFGAMAYHFIHEIKEKKGMVAKTVATSNLANNLAQAFGEEVFEPRVGFKEFKPVIDRALVCFEESDGISVIGHTPEKDSFIGLILAIDMVTTLKKNLGDYLREIEDTFGVFFPDRDGIAVSQKGDDLQNSLSVLEKYGVGSKVLVGSKEKIIKEVLTIDGRKMILEDDSWIMIRPSGTESKVRFYVEARQPSEPGLLIQSAKSMLAETGVID